MPLLLVALLVLMPGQLLFAKTLDLRVLVDVSQPMARSDPDSVRAGALRLLLEMLPDDARAGVWSYSDTPRILMSHGRTNQLWRTQAAMRANVLPSGAESAELSPAIAEAASASSIDPAQDRHLLLITAESDHGQLSERSYLSLLGRLRTGGYQLTVLALPARQGSENQQLRTLAVQSGGRYLRVADFGSIEFALAAFADAVLPVERLPLDADRGFIVEQGLEEMTLLRLRRAGDETMTLTDPGGKEYSRLTPNIGFSWQVGDNYDLVTFRQPVGGRWYLSGRPGSAVVLARGGVIPRVVGLPAMIFPGELKTFDLKIGSASGDITDPAFLELLELRADVISQAGRVAVPIVRTSRGGYELQLLADQEQGEYQLQVRITGPTFERVTTIPFSIRNPISLRLMPDESAGSIWFTMTSVDIVPQQMRVEAMASRPMLGAEPLAVTQFPGGLWRISLTGEPGLVELTLDIEGKQLNGNDFSIQTKPLVITQPILSGKRYSFDIHGSEVSNQLILDPVAPISDSPVESLQNQPSTDAEALELEEEFQLPLWFVAALAPVNLLVGFAVFFLLTPIARPEGFLSAVAELQAVLSADPDSEAQAVPG